MHKNEDPINVPPEFPSGSIEYERGKGLCVYTKYI
jgi:hypothetical protein